MTSRMAATASYFQHSGVFRILAILTTVFVIALNRAVAHTVRAFPIVCHVTTLLSTAMLEPGSRVVKREEYASRCSNNNRPALLAQSNHQRFVQLNRVRFTINADDEV